MASSVGANLSIDALVEMITKSSKEMFALCYRKADRKTKIAAMPLLEKINDLEIYAFLLDLFLVGNEDVSKPLSSKLILFMDKVQEELTDLKSKWACNKSGLTQQQVEIEHATFTAGIEEVTEILVAIEKRIFIENTVRRNEEVHEKNMELIHAEVKLLQAHKLKIEATEYLSMMNQARNDTEIKVIDAFEEIILESESRQLIYAEQAKKKAEAKCVKAEKKHTEVEMGYLKVRDARRDAFEDYAHVIRKRHRLKVKEPEVAEEQKTPKSHHKSPRSTPGSTPGSTPRSTPRSTPGSTPKSTPRSTPGSTPKSKPKKDKNSPKTRLSAADKVTHSPKPRLSATDKATNSPKPRISAADKATSSPKPRISATGKAQVPPKTRISATNSSKPRLSASDTILE